MVQTRQGIIRVGFALTFVDRGWLGGVNYFRNLLSAIKSFVDRKIEPVLFVGNQCPSRLYKDFPEIELHRTALLDTYGSRWWFRKTCQKVIRRDLVLERMLKFRRIQILSHSASLGRRARLATLGWIPDFQHRHLAEFFSAKEYATRERGLRRLCRESRRLLVSSWAARRDLAEFSPEAAVRSSVLHFVVDPGMPESLVDTRRLQERYGFRGSYLHLPNQFWAHKNHAVVIDALALLKREGRPAQVLATGNTRDTRNCEFFDVLMKRAEQAKVLDCFKVLGIVPYEDLIALMRDADALINPSLFEGWSTTVEEGKSLGKRMILSDLPVHREQEPPGAVFFEARDAVALASAIERIRFERDPEIERRLRDKAQTELPARKRSFAMEYEKIVELALQS